jgi:predicted nucleic acid-binding protein
MHGVVVDTDFVSFLLRNEPTGNKHSVYLRAKQRIISFMTLAEIEYGMLNRKWGWSRRRRMEQHLLLFTVCWPDADVCKLWGWVREICGRLGRPIATNDAWIAATALRLDLPLMTNNPADYRAITGLTVIP